MFVLYPDYKCCYLNLLFGAPVSVHAGTKPNQGNILFSLPRISGRYAPLILAPAEGLPSGARKGSLRSLDVARTQKCFCCCCKIGVFQSALFNTKLGSNNSMKLYFKPGNLKHCIRQCSVKTGPRTELLFLFFKFLIISWYQTVN